MIEIRNITKQILYDNKYMLLSIFGLLLLTIFPIHRLRALVFLVVQFLILLELFIWDTHIEKISKKIQKIFRFIVIPIIVIYFLAGYCNLIKLYGMHLLTYHVICIVILLLFVVTYLILHIVTKTNSYFLILFFRHILYLIKNTGILFAGITILVTSLSGIGLVGELEIKYCNNFFNTLHWSYMLGILSLGNLFLFAMLYDSVATISKQKLLYFIKPKTMLFLRSFTFDNDNNADGIINTLVDYSKNKNYSLLKIGSPQTIFTFDQFDIYYLPTTNWQKHLNKLISLCKTVFVVLGDTPGVSWEIFNHKEHWWKYIFYIPDKSTADFYIKYSKKNKIPVFSDFLRYLLEKSTPFPIAFFIENGLYFFSNNIYSIITKHETNEYVKCDYFIFNDPISQIKITADHTCYLYNKNTVIKYKLYKGTPLYLSISEFDQLSYFRQPLSCQYRKLPCCLSRDVNTLKLHLETLNLLQIYIFDYRYYIFFIEPVLICVMIKFLSPSTPALIQVPLIILFFVFLLSVQAAFTMILSMDISNVILKWRNRENKQ